MDKGPKKAPEAHATHHGEKIICAACHNEIQGTPVEKNGYLYHPGHERMDDKKPPRT